MKKKRAKKKLNPLARKITVKFRVNAIEMKILNLKSHAYCKGNSSKYLREAFMEYKRETKKEV